MTQPRLTRIALMLAILALAFFIAGQLWLLGAALGNIVSVIAVSWLLALIIKPFVHFLRGGLVPPLITRWVARRYGDARARRLAALRLPFGVAVAIMYLGLLFAAVGGLAFATASLVPQVVDLAGRLPEISADLPAQATSALQGLAMRLGINPGAFDLTRYVSPQEISSRVAQLAGLLAGQAVSLAALTAGALGQVFLVLILSLYVVIEDKLIARQFYAVLPLRWHEIARAITSGIDRAFNGYLRAQVISAVIHGAAALLVFSLFGVNFGVVVALLFALLSVVPLIGIPIAILVAAVVTLISAPAVVLPVVIILLVIDQVVAYVVVPKLMMDSTGVPSLFALLAIIVGVQVVGFWGLVFGVPLIGSIYAIVFDVILPRQRRAAGLPDLDPELAALARKPQGVTLPGLPADAPSSSQASPGA